MFEQLKRLRNVPWGWIGMCGSLMELGRGGGRAFLLSNAQHSTAHSSHYQLRGCQRSVCTPSAIPCIPAAALSLHSRTLQGGHPRECFRRPALASGSSRFENLLSLRLITPRSPLWPTDQGWLGRRHPPQEPPSRPSTVSRTTCVAGRVVCRFACWIPVAPALLVVKRLHRAAVP